jgi:hypothetical protein
MRKLLTTTAIASVALAGAAIAEVKVSGSIEQTINSNSYDKATEQHKGSTAIGSETNLTVSSSKELDNGMTVSGSFRMENTTIDHKSFKISSGGFAMELGIDTGTNITGDILPTVADQTHDFMKHTSNGGTTVLMADSLIGGDAHDREHIGFSYKTDAGTFAINYAPDDSAANNSSSAVTDAGGSALEYVFAGGLGVDGLNVKVGQQKSESDTTSDGDITEKTYQASYTYGQFSVGAAIRDLDDETSTTEKSKSNAYAVSYAVNDQISISYEDRTTETDSTTDKDEEAKAFSVGYNLGGLAIVANYGTVDNMGGASGENGEAFQLRSVYKF